MVFFIFTTSILSSLSFKSYFDFITALTQATFNLSIPFNQLYSLKCFVHIAYSEVETEVQHCVSRHFIALLQANEVPHGVSGDQLGVPQGDFGGLLCLGLDGIVVSHCLTLVKYTRNDPAHGTYHIGEQRKLRRACASAQSRQNVCCSLTWSMK